MAMTLGLNTAISGLLTSQQALNVVSQNVVNVNTVGYTRKTLSPESRVLDGVGAGVQSTLLQRTVDQYLAKEARRQTSTLKHLGALADAYANINATIGKVGDANSVAHLTQQFTDSLSTLGGSPTRSDAQWSAVQNAVDLTDSINSMSEQLLNLRTSVDGQIADAVTSINQQLSNIADLSTNIVRGMAVNQDVTDLQDKRDVALDKLAELIDFTYQERGDGSISVYTGNGIQLVDSQAATLSHNAVSSNTASTSLASGQYDKITTDGINDITNSIKDGKLKGLIELRDSIVPDLHSSLDEMSQTMMEEMNLAHNRGTSLPSVSSSFVGTRTFADQTNLQQTISLSGTEDTALIVYDAEGNQAASTTLRNLMNGTAYAVPKAAVAQPWSIDTVASRMQDWMNEQTYPNASLATAGLDSDGHFAISTGNTGYGLAFRDQVDSSQGAATTDISVSFDVDSSNGTNADETVAGFANFLGLNDFFVTNTERGTIDSAVLNPATKLTATRDLTLYDSTGKLGNTITVGAGASLSTIAAAINKQTKTMDSAVSLSGSIGITGSSANTISIKDVSGSTLSSYTIPAATVSVSLTTIAAGLNGQNNILAKVVDDGNGSRLRVWDSNGAELSVSYSGNDSTTLSEGLDMQATQRVSAAVVPDGSGVRLRITEVNGGEVFMSSTGASSNMITELQLDHSSSGAASSISVREDLQTAPVLVSRGAVQWNTDSQKYFISEGDNTTVNAMANAFQKKTSFASAGSLSANKYSISEYATAIISTASSGSAKVTEREKYQQTLTDDLVSRNRAFSGVNLDEEVSSMMNYQQAYTASARVITTLSEMLDTLIGIVK